MEYNRKIKEVQLKDNHLLIINEQNENVVLAQIFHFIKNESGGSFETPIGFLVCYKEFSYPIWRIKIILRSDVRYNQTRRHAFVFTKSIYRNKLKFYINKIKDFFLSYYKLDKTIDKEIIQYLLQNSLISEPYSVSRSFEKIADFHFIGKMDDCYD